MERLLRRRAALIPRVKLARSRSRQGIHQPRVAQGREDVIRSGVCLGFGMEGKCFGRLTTMGWITERKNELRSMPVLWLKGCPFSILLVCIDVENWYVRC